jgi:decaprenylphospho-beta-D-erythro-pentofuranosid-2-ulose 2-reductase
MNLLILGANSDIAQEIARQFASKASASITLASRNMEELHRQVQDLSIRHGIFCKAVYFDALDYASHLTFFRSLNPMPDGVVVAFGLLGKRENAQRDSEESIKIIETNYSGAVSILEIVASDFEARRSGFIIAFSSVAGIRGRQSNYLYGSAKGGLQVYLSGLRNRLYRSGVPVITVIPGFVRTKMTAGMQLPRYISGDPCDIAKDVYRAYKNGKDIVYTKWIWRWIMLLIRLIPEKIFKRLKL